MCLWNRCDIVIDVFFFEVCVCVCESNLTKKQGRHCLYDEWPGPLVFCQVCYCSCESTSKYQILVWRIEVWLPGFLPEVFETHGKVPSQVDIFAEGTSSKQPIFTEFYHVCESQKEHHPSKSYLLNLIDITLELWWVNSVKVMLPFWAWLVSYGDRLWQNNRYKSRGSKSSRRGGYECCHAGECPDGGSWQE